VIWAILHYGMMGWCLVASGVVFIGDLGPLTFIKIAKKSLKGPAGIALPRGGDAY